MNSKKIMARIAFLLVIIMSSTAISAQEYIALKSVAKAKPLPKYAGELNIGYGTSSNYFVETVHGVVIDKKYFIGLGAAYQTDFDASSTVPVFAQFKMPLPLDTEFAPFAFAQAGYTILSEFSGDAPDLRETHYTDGFYSAIGVGATYKGLTLSLGWRLSSIEKGEPNYYNSSNNSYYYKNYSENSLHQFTIKLGINF